MDPVKPISKEEYEKIMKQMMDIQLMAEAATKALYNLKIAIASIGY